MSDPSDEAVSHPNIQLTDSNGNVMLTIYAGTHQLKLSRLGADMTFEWRPADIEIKAYEQSGDPAYREECRRVFGEIWADVIRRMTTPEIKADEA